MSRQKTPDTDYSFIFKFIFAQQNIHENNNTRENFTENEGFECAGRGGQEVNVEARFVFFGEMQRLGFWRQTRNFPNICHAPNGAPTACGCLVVCAVDVNACSGACHPNITVQYFINIWPTLYSHQISWIPCISKLGPLSLLPPLSFSSEQPYSLLLV